MRRSTTSTDRAEGRGFLAGATLGKRLRAKRPSSLWACVVVVAGILSVPISSRAVDPQDLLVFGSDEQTTFLGCLNCDTSSPASIFNPDGEYGHCRGAWMDNLYCRGAVSNFGNHRHSQKLSACTSYASAPPVIRDGAGGYHGRLSISTGSGHVDSVCDTSSLFYAPSICHAARVVCAAKRRRGSIGLMSDSAASAVLAAAGNVAAEACKGGHWISSVMASGKFVVLEDHSVWRVLDTDRNVAIAWNALETVRVCSRSLINVDRGITIKASRVL